jgi:glycosyltransferase involved in cell wall biosynthesis
MSKKYLVIINNEKITKDENNFYCENIDIKSISEDLNENFNVTLIARESKKINRIRKINLLNIKALPNIFLFLLSLFGTFKKDKTIYLIISITPYTFFSYILLLIFRKKKYVYLRSNGHEEYKAIFGFVGPIIYDFMFKVVTFNSSIISCQKRLFEKRKSHIVFPSELNSSWIKNTVSPKLDKPRLLYIGRLKVEKGIFSLMKILNQVNLDFTLSIIGGEEKNLNTKYKESKKYEFYPIQNETNLLINFYDKSNIFILPSFTEAHPKVVDESLARLRPVIIFDDIKYIIHNKKGIFVSQRNEQSLFGTIDFIMKNYITIQENMKQNKLPTKKNFITEMSNILSQS